MADIRLDPASLDPVIVSFVSTGTDMESTINQCFQTLDGIKENLAGYTNEAWGEWQQEFNQRHARLQEDFSQGLRALNTMKEEIIDADNAGRAYFPH
jgi:uncharacterized protein YukE